MTDSLPTDLDLWRVGLNGTAFIGMYRVNPDGTAGPGTRAGDGEYIYAKDALREIERLRDALGAIAAPGPLEQCTWQTECARKALRGERS